jgi:hypothetical protein
MIFRPRPRKGVVKGVLVLIAARKILIRANRPTRFESPPSVL